MNTRSAFLCLFISTAARAAQGTLNVHVVNEQGEPVPQAIIYVSHGSEVFGRTWTPDRVIGLPQGRYNVQAAWTTKVDGRTSRQLSRPLTIELPAGQVTSLLLPLLPLGDNLLAAALLGRQNSVVNAPSD